MTDVVVRRRAGLMAAVALLSAGLASAYAWRSSVDHDGTAALIATLLGLVALGHAKAWVGAREPLLIADSTGIRLRLGSAWTGLPWESVERIEVVERRRVHDGQVVIVAKPEAGVLARSGVRTKVAAALNRQLYDESLVVPFGLSTSSTVVDIATSLDRLAAGRAAVLLVGRLEDAPEPTVEITFPDSRTQTDRDLGRALPVERAQQKPSPRLARTSTGGRLRRGVFTARTSAPGAVRQVSATVTSAARREEIAITPRAHPATIGGLALSEPIEVPAATDLPEAAELRRTDHGGRDHDLSGGNVSLIIDATTDLSARAMQRVRRAEARTNTGASGTVAAVDYGAVIGGELASARLRKGIGIDELAERTRIRPYVIESIEVDDFSPCGGDFYARGHIRMLAHAVGLDPGPLVTAYEQHFSTSPVNPRDVFEAELARGGRGSLRAGGERSSNWGALVAAVLTLVMVWAVAQYLTGGSPTTPSLSQPTTSASGLGSPGPGNPPVHGPRTAQVKVSVTGGESRVVIKDRFKRTVFSGVLSDGAQRKVHGEAPLRVQASDGGVVSLRSNGLRLGVMGDAGERARERISAHPLDPASPTRQQRPGSGGAPTIE